MHADLTDMLRATGDTTDITVPSLDLQSLMQEFNIDLPPNLPYGPNTRTDIPYTPVLGNDAVVEPR
jgi:hypothetical protein